MAVEFNVSGSNNAHSRSTHTCSQSSPRAEPGERISRVKLARSAKILQRIGLASFLHSMPLLTRGEAPPTKTAPEREAQRCTALDYFLGNAKKQTERLSPILNPDLSSTPDVHTSSNVDECREPISLSNDPYSTRASACSTRSALQSHCQRKEQGR
jgi:hypothetical protein